MAGPIVECGCLSHASGALLRTVQPPKEDPASFLAPRRPYSRKRDSFVIPGDGGHCLHLLNLLQLTQEGGGSTCCCGWPNGRSRHVASLVPHGTT